MKKIYVNLNPYTFTGSAFLVGLALTNELSSLEQVSVGNWLQLVGLTMQTYSSQNDVLNPNEDDNPSDDLDKIKKAIAKIEEELNKLK